MRTVLEALALPRVLDGTHIIDVDEAVQYRYVKDGAVRRLEFRNVDLAPEHCRWQSQYGLLAEGLLTPCNVIAV